MSSQTTCADTRSAISSQESADGPLRSSSQDGQLTVPSGQEAVLASHSARWGVDSDRSTRAISGQNSFGSSASAALQQCLANRLRARMGEIGYPAYSMTWKAWPMPSREPICALRALACRTLDSVFTGLPTPTKPSRTNGHQAGNNRYVSAIQRRFGGKINPPAVGWQMGFPAEWSMSAPTATR